MRKWLLIPLLVVLTGCVSYYYPYPAEQANQTYYPAERPARSDYSASYASTRYYPWWSVDYFYLGSGRGYSNSSYSIGFSYGYPYNYSHGWYDPFAWYYDPWGWSVSYPLQLSYWYTPYYSRFHDRYAWRNHYWRYRYERHHRSRHHDHDRWNRWARGERDRRGDGWVDRGHPRDDHSSLRPNRPRLRDQSPVAGYDRDRDSLRRRYEDGRIPAAARGKYPKPGKPGGESAADRVKRHMSVAPGSREGSSGMEIRNRGERKAAPTRTQPSPAPAGRPNPAAAVVTTRPPVVRERTYTARPERVGRTIVRSPTEQKPQPIRIQPAPASRPGQENLSPVVRYEPPSARGRPQNTPATPERDRVSAWQQRTQRPTIRPAQPAGPPPRNSSPRIAVPVQRSVPARMAPAQPAPRARSVPAPRPSMRPAPARPEPQVQAQPERGKPADRPSRPGKGNRR